MFFSVIVNKEDLKTGMDEVTNRLQYWLKIAKIPLTQKLLNEACPAIEANLRSVTNLPSLHGKKAFYDTETEDAYWNRPSNKKGFLGAKYHNNYKRSEHLLDCWKVDPIKLSAGGNAIRIYNTKKVSGRSGEFSLFRLLWEGTNYFVAPVHLTNADIALVKKRDMFKHYDKLEAFGFMVNPRRGAAPGKGLANLPGLVNPPMRLGTGGRPNPAFRHDRNDNRSIYSMHRQPITRMTIKSPEELMNLKKERILWLKNNAGLTKSEMPSRLRRIQKKQYERNPAFARRGGLIHGEGAAQARQNLQYAMQPARFVTGHQNTLTNWNNPKRMNFYCRYAGKFYYNQSQRRGIEKPMVQEFHDYVADCVYKGLFGAIGQTFSDGTSTQLMKKVFRDIDMK